MSSVSSAKEEAIRIETDNSGDRRPIVYTGYVYFDGAVIFQSSNYAPAPDQLVRVILDIAVNPLNSRQIAVIAFSDNWGPSSSAPIWKSDGGGDTWRKVLQLPQPTAGQSGPGDQKIAFDRNGNLYVAELAVDSLNSNFDYIYRQNGAPDATMLVGAEYGDDQPHLDIDKTSRSPCVDRLYSPWLNTQLPLNQSNVENSSSFGANVADVPADDNSRFPNRTTRIASAPACPLMRSHAR